MSLPPPSGVMKPNPFSPLNHLTVPVVRIVAVRKRWVCRRWSDDCIGSAVGQSSVISYESPVGANDPGGAGVQPESQRVATASWNNHRPIAVQSLALDRT